MSEDSGKVKKKKKASLKATPDRIGRVKEDSSSSDGGSVRLDGSGSIRLVPGLSAERSRTMTVIKLSNFFNSGTQVESQDSTLHTVISRVDRFVDDYEEALTFLLSEIQLPWHEFASFKARNEQRLLALEELLRARTAPNDLTPALDALFSDLPTAAACSANQQHARLILPAFFDAAALFDAPDDASAASSLSRLLRAYEALQQSLFDPHVEAVYRWWLPQLLELRATAHVLRGGAGAVYAQGMLRYVRASTAIACVLLTGGYLRVSPVVAAQLSGATATTENAIETGRKLAAELRALEARVGALRGEGGLPSRRAASAARAPAPAADGFASPPPSDGHTFRFERRKSCPLLGALATRGALAGALEAQLKEVPEEFCASLLNLRRGKAAAFPPSALDPPTPSHSLAALYPPGGGGTQGEGYYAAPSEAFCASGPTNLAVNREESLALLEATCRVKEYVEWMRREWAGAQLAQAAQFMRSVLLLAHQVEFFGELDTVFCVPALWQVWLDFVGVMRGVVIALVRAAQDKAAPTDLQRVQTPLASIVVHLRWMSSQLLCIQNMPPVGVFYFNS